MGEPFPQNWTVLSEADYITFRQSAKDEQGRGLHVLIKLDPSHRALGHRLCIVGGGPIKVRIRLTTIMQPLPDNLKACYLEYHCPNEFATPPDGSTATAWQDVEQMLRDKSAVITDDAGQLVQADQVITWLAKSGTEKRDGGASLRWMVAVCDESGFIQLELQSMPATAKFLNKGQLKGENAVSVLVGVVELYTDVFESEVVAGPVPIFFSNVPGAAKYLEDHPDEVLEDICMTNAHFLVPEHITLTDAYTYLRKRTRAAKGVPAYPYTKAPRPKRARMDNQPDTEPGNYLLPVSHLQYVLSYPV
jgi:hypothetical protein